MDHDELPTYADFLDHGIENVNPDDITEDERGKCSGCSEDFGEPNADGVVEELRHHKPFIRDLEPLFQAVAESSLTPVAHGALTFVPMDAESSATMRARDVEVNLELACHVNSLMIMLIRSNKWPPGLRVTMADIHRVAAGVSAMTEWQFYNYAERLQPGVSNCGAASVEAAWDKVSDESAGPLAMRCTAMFVQTFLARYLGVITHEQLVALA